MQIEVTFDKQKLKIKDFVHGYVKGIYNTHFKCHHKK